MSSFKNKNLQIEGIAKGGVENCFAVLPWQIGFDIGRCPSFMIDIPHIFLSHGHLDHAAGIPYYFSQRSLRGVASGKIYVPHEIEEPLKKILKHWQKIEKFDYPILVQGLNAFDEITINKNLFVKALPSFHRVASLGYIVYERRHKLKKEFSALEQKEIIERKERGEIITETISTPLLAYSGDTTIDFIITHPEVGKAKVLLMECTYIDDERPIQRAKNWGHTHLYEIIEHQHLFQNEKLLLVHLSRRYSSKAIRLQLEKKLTPYLKEKVEVFGI